MNQSWLQPFTQVQFEAQDEIGASNKRRSAEENTSVCVSVCVCSGKIHVTLYVDELSLVCSGFEFELREELKSGGGDMSLLCFPGCTVPRAL